MIKYRPNTSRKHMGDTWIETYRSFSNNTYWDPRYVNYNLLEVINDDRVQPHNFVPIHQHMDMEILGYIVEGKCYHNDNLHNILEVPKHGVQHMSAGTGIWHVEGNNSNESNRYLQIWLRPNVMGIPPKYDVYEFSREEKLNRFCMIASKYADPNEAIVIQSDAEVYAGIFTQNHREIIDSKISHYLYVVTGSATINGYDCVEGDAVIYENESHVVIENANDSEMILFNLT